MENDRLWKPVKVELQCVPEKKRGGRMLKDRKRKEVEREQRRKGRKPTKYSSLYVYQDAFHN